MKIISQLDVTLENYRKKIEYKWMGLHACKRWQVASCFHEKDLYAYLSTFCIVAPTSEFVAVCMALDG